MICLAISHAFLTTQLEESLQKVGLVLSPFWMPTVLGDITERLPSIRVCCGHVTLGCIYRPGSWKRVYGTHENRENEGVAVTSIPTTGFC